LQSFGVAMKRKELEVRIDLLSTSDGGRSAPILSGYRSLIRFGGADVDFGFELQLGPECAKGLAPGNSGSARLSLWAVDDVPPLRPGQKFELREGRRIIGRGTVLDTKDS